MAISLRGSKPTTWRSLQEPLLHKERLVHFLDRSLILSNCGGDCLHSNWPALELLDDRLEYARVHVVETELVDVEKPQRILRDRASDCSAGFYLRVIADAAEQTVRNTRRSA